MKVAGKNMQANWTAIIYDKKILDHFKQTLPDGHFVAYVSIAEKVIATLMDAGIIKGVRSVSPPSSPFPYMFHLKPAVAAEDKPDLSAEAELYMWNPNTNTWVDPTQELISEMHEYYGSKDCYIPADKPTVINYSDFTEGYLNREWVRGEHSGLIRMSTYGTPEDPNYIDTDHGNLELRARYWKYGFTDEEFCDAVRGASASIINAFRLLTGNDAVTPVTLDELKLALNSVINEGIKVWFNGITDSVALGIDGKLYLANPTGSPSTNEPSLQASRPTHWFGPYSNLAKLISDLSSQINNKITGGAKKWEKGDSGLNGNSIVLVGDKYFIANADGDPANNDPSLPESRPSHWFGPFNTLSEVIKYILGAGLKSDNQKLSIDCNTSRLDAVDKNGNKCSFFLINLSGAVMSAPTTVTSGDVDIQASVTDPTNGKGGYTYIWKLNGNQISTAKSIKFNAPSSVGTVSLTCQITDADGKSTILSQNINVEPDLSDEVLWEGNVNFGNEFNGGTKIITTLPMNSFPNVLISLNTAATNGDSKTIKLSTAIGSVWSQGYIEDNQSDARLEIKSATTIQASSIRSGNVTKVVGTHG